jgi:hypothetical protein
MVLAISFIGCDDTPADREQKIENAADKTGDVLQKGAEKTGEALDKAARSTGEVVGEVTDQISRTKVDVDVDVTTRPAADPTTGPAAP